MDGEGSVGANPLAEGPLHEGVVREWWDEHGWGVIDCPATPGGCWTHFSAVVSRGYRRLETGASVTFAAEQVEQDGYRYRAVLVWPQPPN